MATTSKFNRVNSQNHLSDGALVAQVGNGVLHHVASEQLHSAMACSATLTASMVEASLDASTIEVSIAPSEARGYRSRCCTSCSGRGDNSNDVSLFLNSSVEEHCRCSSKVLDNTLKLWLSKAWQSRAASTNVRSSHAAVWFQQQRRSVALFEFDEGELAWR